MVCGRARVDEMNMNMNMNRNMNNQVLDDSVLT
jgi:hypothetical protein